MEGFNTVSLIIAFPLIGFLIQSLLGGFIVKKMGPTNGKRLLGTLAVLPIAAAFAVGVTLTLTLSKMDPGSRAAIVPVFDWISLKSLVVPFELRVDPLSMTMTLIITGVGALIHLYATGYMAEEKDYPRFFTYLNLFVAFMLTLVLGNNLALLFIGWEGVGLCSYLLIGFWYKDLANAKAANKAFIVNRIGDWGMTLGIFFIVVLMGSNIDKLPGHGGRLLSYDVIFSRSGLDIFVANPAITTAIALLLFVGAMGKSAQFPLYTWLPDAMAGPTPVSALIHAATMVTAGVVLLNRCQDIFQLSPMASMVVAVIGAFTALFAALIAFGQTDIKKVLAYSTVSQLGFMFVACGVGAYWVGIFHVTTHAFFKALLFLGSGSVIHAMSHDQDMRNFGNLKKYIPITFITMFIGWLAIAGFPLLAGFWSKEAILGGAFGNEFAAFSGFPFGQVTGWLLLFVAFLTAGYMTRMTFLTFYGGTEQWRALPAQTEHAHHEDHGHAHHEDHGPDTHRFFYTDEEMAARHDEHEHHHELNSEHTPHESPPSMWVPLVVLAAASLAGGWLLHNNHLLQHWLSPEGLTSIQADKVSGHPHGFLGQSLPVVGSMLALFGILAGLLGIAYGWFVYRKGLPAKEREESGWDPFRRGAGQQFGYDSAMTDMAVGGGGALATWCYKTFDAKLVDGLVNGVGKLTAGLGMLVRTLQTGYVRAYALLFLFGVVAVFGYLAYVAQKMGGVQ